MLHTTAIEFQSIKQAEEIYHIHMFRRYKDIWFHELIGRVIQCQDTLYRSQPVEWHKNNYTFGDLSPKGYILHEVAADKFCDRFRNMS